jgi:hydroxymethylbilane synthase
LEDASARRCVEAERSFLQALGGGCRLPIGALAEERSGSLTLTGMICSIDGKALVRRKLSAEVTQPTPLGVRLADNVIAAGGAEIMRSLDGRAAGS